MNMPQGLQIWDANGNIWLDITERLGILHTEITTQGVSGSVQLPDAYGNVFVYIAGDTPKAVYNSSTGTWLARESPNITYNPTTRTVTWSYYTSWPKSSARLIIGFY